MSKIIKRNEWDTKIKKVVKAICCRKHSVFVSGNYVGGNTHMTCWDGGSRSSYVVVTAAGEAYPLPLVLDPNRFNDPFGQRHITPPVEALPENAIAVVKVGVFRGKAATPFIQWVERVENA